MGLQDKAKAAVLCCVSLAQVSSSLGAHVAHDKHSDPFGAVFFIISVCLVFSLFSTSAKYLRQI